MSACQAYVLEWNGMEGNGRVGLEWVTMAVLAHAQRRLDNAKAALHQINNNFLFCNNGRLQPWLTDALWAGLADIQLSSVKQGLDASSCAWRMGQAFQ